MPLHSFHLFSPFARSGLKSTTRKASSHNGRKMLKVIINTQNWIPYMLDMLDSIDFMITALGAPLAFFLFAKVVSS